MFLFSQKNLVKYFQYGTCPSYIYIYIYIINKTRHSQNNVYLSEPNYFSTICLRVITDNKFASIFIILSSVRITATEENASGLIVVCSKLIKASEQIENENQEQIKVVQSVNTSA